MITLRPRPSSPSAQRGAVLIISLVLLAIMTLLAVTAMNMNSMEERMSANSQENNRYFQAAESGLAMAIADNNAFVTGTPLTSPVVVIPPYNANVVYTSAFVMETSPKRGTGWDATKFAFYYFNINSIATSATTNLSTSVNAGTYQVAKK